MLRRATVNKVFGPTYAGDALKFPGLMFGFEEDGMMDGTMSKKKKTEEKERLQEVKRVLVIQRPDEDGSKVLATR